VAQSIRPGQIVSSRQGRDAGTVYCVLKMIDERSVLVADGKKRTVNRPRVKNTRHLQIHSHVDSGLDQALSGKIKVTDEDVRKAVERFSGREEGSLGHGKG